MNRKGIVGAVMLSVLLAACRDDTPAPPSGGGSTGGYTKFGYVTVSSNQLSGDSQGRATVAYGIFASGPGASAVPPTATGAADTCLVIQAPLSQNDINPLNPAFNSIDAGDPVVIKSGAANYATLARSAPGANLFAYSSGAGQLDNPTATLTVSTPGAANGFPAFSDVAFPTTLPAPLTITAPADNAPVTPETKFTWDGAGDDANSFVLLVNLQVLNWKEAIYAVCNARDDGEFTFPDATKAALAAQGWTAGNLFIASRSVTRTVTRGDAALVLAIVDGEVFSPAALPGLGATSRQMIRDIIR